jgi:hypothetical protein
MLSDFTTLAIHRYSPATIGAPHNGFLLTGESLVSSQTFSTFPRPHLVLHSQYFFEQIILYLQTYNAPFSLPY